MFGISGKKSGTIKNRHGWSLHSNLDIVKKEDYLRICLIDYLFESNNYFWKYGFPKPKCIKNGI